MYTYLFLLLLLSLVLWPIRWLPLWICQTLPSTLPKASATGSRLGGCRSIALYLNIARLQYLIKYNNIQNKEKKKVKFYKNNKCINSVCGNKRSSKYYVKKMTCLGFFRTKENQTKVRRVIKKFQKNSNAPLKMTNVPSIV